MEKNKIDRARQFLPFNSLKGYYDLTRKQEIIKEKRKTLADEELAILSFKFNNLKRGMLVKVKYYQDYGYVTLEGMISNIDLVYRKIRIVEKNIDFNDIIDIESSLSMSKLS